MSEKRSWILRLLIGCALLLAICVAQEATEESQASLGDVARQQKQRPHTAKRVVGDEDIAPSGMRMIGAQGNPITIPSPHISGYIPVTVEEENPVYGRYITREGHHKIYVAFGPDTPEYCGCADALPTAEERYIASRLPGDGHSKGKGRVLFDSDTRISGYPARTARVEASGQLEPLQGTIALIAVPEEIMSAACYYPQSDAAGAEAICDNFIASLSINFPEKYIRIPNPMAY
jgi:hypothetical protein